MLCGRLVWNTRVDKKITQLALAGRTRVLQIAKRNYPSATKSVVDKFLGETIKALATKINKEINNLCSSETITVFKKGCENIDSLWKHIWSDINLHLPTTVDDIPFI